MGTIDIILALASGGGAAGIMGVAWNLRNSWLAATAEAVARERRHLETTAELRQNNAVQAEILRALVERMDRTEIRQDRFESRLEALSSRKD